MQTMGVVGAGSCRPGWHPCAIALLEYVAYIHFFITLVLGLDLIACHVLPKRAAGPSDPGFWLAQNPNLLRSDRPELLR